MTASAWQLDLRVRSPQRRPFAGWLLLALGAMLVLLSWPVHEDQSERLALARDREALQQARARPRAAKPPSNDPVDLRRIERANAAIDQLTLPWQQLFDAVEQADSRELSLVSLMPDAKDGSVRLTGEARSVADVLRYIERLGARPGWSAVRLLAYTSIRRGETRLVGFTLGARWTGS